MEPRENEGREVPRLSTGDPSTLGTYLRLARALAPGSKFEKLIRDKIAESPNGEDEVVVAAENQMMYLFSQMLDPVGAEESKNDN